MHALLPTVGMIGGAVLLASLGLGAALVARRWAKAMAEPDASAEARWGPYRTEAPTPDGEDEAPAAPEIDASKDPDPDVTREPWLLLALLFGTGCAGVGLEVVAVQKNFLPMQDIILVKSADPKLAVSGFWRGMSGSPLYIDGKLACAFSYGWAFNKIAMGGCTPRCTATSCSGGRTCDEASGLCRLVTTT